MSIYRAELSWDNLTMTGETPAAGRIGDGARIAFSFQFTDAGAILKTAAPQLDLLIHSFGVGPTYEYQTQQQLSPNTPGPQPINFGAPVNAVLEANGQNGAAFQTMPITLSLSVDDTAHQATLTGPLGSQTYSFTTLAW